MQPGLAHTPAPDHLRRRLAPATLIVGVVGAALIAIACTNTVRVGLPPGVVEDEARRMVAAVGMASDAYRTKKPEVALDRYRDALRTYRELPAAWNNMGVLMMDRDEYLQAAEAFGTAAELAPSDPRPHYNLGLLYDRRGYVREARGYYERSLSRDAGFLPSLRAAVRADSLLHEGNEQTLEWVQRALFIEKDPEWQEWLKLQRVRMENMPAIKMKSNT